MPTFTYRQTRGKPKNVWGLNLAIEVVVADFKQIPAVVCVIRSTRKRRVDGRRIDGIPL